VDRLREHGRGGRAVAGDVRGLAGDLADQLRAHVLARVLEIDLLRHRHAVLGAGRRSVLLLQDDVPAARPERHLDGTGQLVHTAEDRLTAVLRIDDFFCRHVGFPFQLMIPRISSSRTITCSMSSIRTSVPMYLPMRTRSPAATSRAMRLPSSSRRPAPTAMTVPSSGFSLAVSGMMMPPFAFCSGSMRLTRTRSFSGLILDFIGMAFRECRIGRGAA